MSRDENLENVVGWAKKILCYFLKKKIHAVSIQTVLNEKKFGGRKNWKIIVYLKVISSFYIKTILINKSIPHL